MKLNFVFIGLMIIGLLGCSKDEDSLIDNLTNKTWQLQSINGKYETVAFNKDATYIITAKTNPIVSSASVIATIKGAWQYENSQITFMTAKVELPGSNSTGNEIPAVIGVSYGVLNGTGFSYLNGTGYNSTLNMDSLLKINSNYNPTVWTIKELTMNNLTVENNNTILIYNSK